METITTRQIGVVCVCGAQEMTLIQEMLSPERKRTTLSCPCGESITETLTLETVRALACGPNGQGEVVVGRFWGLER